MLASTIALVTLGLGQIQNRPKHDAYRSTWSDCVPPAAGRLVGTFDHRLSRMMVPGGKPIEVKSKAVGKWIIQGRLLQVTTVPAKGEELKIESQALLSYDSFRKTYTVLLIDS